MARRHVSGLDEHTVSILTTRHCRQARMAILHSDSNQSSNTKAVAKRNSQRSYIAMQGHAPIMFR